MRPWCRTVLWNVLTSPDSSVSRWIVAAASSRVVPSGDWKNSKNTRDDRGPALSYDATTEPPPPVREAHRWCRSADPRSSLEGHRWIIRLCLLVRGGRFELFLRTSMEPSGNRGGVLSPSSPESDQSIGILSAKSAAWKVLFICYCRVCMLCLYSLHPKA
jgi:hypothetical protein